MSASVTRASGATSFTNKPSTDANTNGEVSKLQSFLKSAGYFPQSKSITGTFGYITQQSLQKFQTKYSVSESRVTGPKTLALIKDISCNANTLKTPDTPVRDQGTICNSEQYKDASGVCRLLTVTCPNGQTIPAMLSCPTSTSTTNPPYKLEATAKKIFKMIVNFELIDNRYDIDGNGSIDQNDASALLNGVAVLPTKFPIEAYDKGKIASEMVVGLRPTDLSFDIDKNGKIENADVIIFTKIGDKSIDPVTLQPINNNAVDTRPATTQSTTPTAVVTAQAVTPDTTFQISFPAQDATLTTNRTYTTSWYAGNDNKADNYQVYLINQKSNEQTYLGVASQSQSSFSFTIPGNVKDGTYALNFSGKAITGGKSKAFTVITQPSVTSLTPASGKPGDIINVQGSALTNLTITLGGVAATPIYGQSVNDIPLKFSIPKGLTSGTYDLVIMQNGTQISGGLIKGFMVSEVPASTAPARSSPIYYPQWKFQNSLQNVLGASTSNTCTDLPINLFRGMEKPSVTTLQKFLINKDLLGGEPTGFYGDKTVEAVKDYQRSKGLPETGMVYDFTRSAINMETCR
jgi:hypothetical protein